MAAHLVLYSALPGRAHLNLVEKLTYGGGFGVFFFFGLTGYLLFWPFAKQHFGSGDSIDLRRYAVNRALRILPLYYVVVVVVLFFDHHITLGTWARFLTFNENFDSFTAGGFIGPAWSLVVELHFYLLLPLLAWAVARLARGSRPWAASLLLAIGLASLLIRIDKVATPDVIDPVWRFNLPTTFLFFIPGMLLALVRLSWEERRPTWLRGPLERADLWILATLPLWGIVVLYHYSLDPLICIASFLLIGACVLPLRSGPLTRALEWRPLAVLGVASYSLYLWHVPVIDALLSIGVVSRSWSSLTLIAVPVVIAAALASYQLIEAPFLRMRRQWARSSAEQEAPALTAPAATPASGRRGRVG